MKASRMETESTPLASRIRSEPRGALPPHVLARQAEKTMRVVAEIELPGEDFGSVQPPPIHVILAGVDAMVARMGGEQLGKYPAKVAAIKLGVDKALEGKDPDIARRCKEAIDRGAGVNFSAHDITDLSRLRPSALTTKAKEMAAIVGHTEGWMTPRAVQELFHGLDDVHSALKKQAVSAGTHKNSEVSKQAQNEVEACILDTAQALREGNEKYELTRNPEHMKMIRNTVLASINDEALAQKCRAIFDAAPPPLAKTTG